MLGKVWESVFARWLCSLRRFRHADLDSGGRRNGSHAFALALAYACGPFCDLRTNVPVPTRYHLVFCPRSTCAGFWPNLFRFRSWRVLDGADRRFRGRRRKTAERESIGFRQRRRVIGCRRGRSSSIGQRCCPHRYDARPNARPHREQDAHGDKANQREPNGPSHRNQGSPLRNTLNQQPHLRHQRPPAGWPGARPGSRSASE